MVSHQKYLPLVVATGTGSCNEGFYLICNAHSRRTVSHDVQCGNNLFVGLGIDTNSGVAHLRNSREPRRQHNGEAILER